MAFTVIVIFAAAPGFAEDNCQNAYTTLEISDCLAGKSSKAHDVMERYLAKAQERFADDKESLDAIAAGQAAWLVYCKAHCDSVYTHWRHGTIRTAKFYTCTQKLAEQRAYVIWKDYLGFADRTPPLLPNPLIKSE